MSNAMKRLLEKLIELMKEEGIRYLNIRRESRWNAEERSVEDTGEYTVNFELDGKFK